MENKEKNLLEKACRWFAITYGQTAEQAGYHSVKVWYKPILMYDLKIHRFSEVVFGPGEKEVDAFIKVQTFIRWGMSVFIWLMFLLILLFISFLITFKVWIVIFVTCICGIAVMVFACMPHYLKPYENLYKDKVITYMDK